MTGAAWERLGLIFRSQGQRPWMRTHAQMPHAEVVEGSVVRVYFSSRDEHNRTHMSWLVVDLQRPDELLDLCEAPLLAPGGIGLFDDSGIMTSWMVIEGGRRRFYTIGWTINSRVPMHTAIGLATGPAQGPPVIDERLVGPVLERGPDAPYYVTCPCVLKSGDDWRMWFTNGLAWGEADGKPVSRYDIAHARSSDGVTWTPDGGSVIALAHPGELAIARPCVVRDPGLWRMWYSYRGETFDYRIGYAESLDGEAWTRRDDHLALAPSGDGFDSAMTCYPYVFDHGGARWMLYCGDGYGQGGMGLARLKESA